MARKKGTFIYSQNIEPLIKGPLDARMTVDSVDDLLLSSTWEDPSTHTWLYNGMIVSVGNDPSTSLNGIYLLIDASNYTLSGSWQKMRVDTGGSGTTTGQNIGNGDASIYAQKVGDNLQFREIKGGAGITIDTSDNTIIIDASGGAGATYNSTLDPSLAAPETVGGIEAGTTVGDLLGSTFTEFVDDLLFPTVYPTFVNPNNSFGDNVASLQEVGDNLNINFTATFSRGSINIGGVFQNYRSGLPNTYTYTGTGLTASYPSTSLTDNRTVNSYNVIIGTQSWTNTVSYDIGPQPLDSKGDPYDSPLSAGTTSVKTTSFEGVYPLYATTSNITTLTKQSLVSMISANDIAFSMVAETGGQKQRFDIPDAWTGAPTSRPLQGIETYNTVSSSWEYQGGSAATSLTFWSTAATTQTVQGNIINYTRYTYNGPDRSNIQIRLKF